MEILIWILLTSCFVLVCETFQSTAIYPDREYKPFSSEAGRIFRGRKIHQKFDSKAKKEIFNEYEIDITTSRPDISHLFKEYIFDFPKQSKSFRQGIVVKRKRKHRARRVFPGLHYPKSREKAVNIGFKNLQEFPLSSKSSVNSKFNDKYRDLNVSTSNFKPLKSNLLTSYQQLRKIPITDTLKKENFPEAFENLSNEELKKITATDIIFGDPLTHTHPLGTHALLPVHKDFDQPHSHPPYKEPPVYNLNPGFSDLIHTALFTPFRTSNTNSTRRFVRRPIPKISFYPDNSYTGNDNKDFSKVIDNTSVGASGYSSRSKSIMTENVSDEKAFRINKNSSFFEHELNIPGHHQRFYQFTRQIPKNNVMKVEALEDPGLEGFRAEPEKNHTKYFYSPIVQPVFHSQLPLRIKNTFVN